MSSATPPQLHLREVLPSGPSDASGAGGCGVMVAQPVGALGTGGTASATGPLVSIADGVGGPYLVVRLPGRAGPCWVAAPATELACGCVRSGQASPWAVVHHSATGTVDLYRTLLDGSVRHSVLLCAQLPTGEAMLSAA
ncbi:MAG: hypothetical protein ACYC1D_19950 [Acidimicrobiales bacterium]